MRIAVVGANGRTGKNVAVQALARGHDVTAIARRPEALELSHPRLAVRRGDVLAPEPLAALFADADAVVFTIGVGTSRKPTTVYSDGIQNVIDAMVANAIRRLAVISAAPVGSRDEQPFLERRILMPVLDRIFGATYEDMRRMETRLGASKLDWIALRPPRLLDKTATGHYRISANGPLPKAKSITYLDLATALLDSVDGKDPLRETAYVAN
ncbi:MAG TPA: NAD(P)H-binding protein [Acidothermaceae bacterium]